MIITRAPRQITTRLATCRHATFQRPCRAASSPSYTARTRTSKYLTNPKVHEGILIQSVSDPVVVRNLESLGFSDGSVVIIAMLMWVQQAMQTRLPPDAINASWAAIIADLVAHAIDKGDTTEMMKSCLHVWSVCSDPARAETFSKALYLCAHTIWNTRRWAKGPSKSAPVGAAELDPLARYFLEASFCMGYPKAALDLATVALAGTHKVITPPALKVVRSAALNRSDARAMALYVRYLLSLDKEANESTRKLAFDLAVGLRSMHNARIRRESDALVIAPIVSPEAPWLLLRDVALQRLERDILDGSGPEYEAVDATLADALRTGAYEYMNPVACEDLSNHRSITEWSTEWVQLKTNTAQTGNANACFLVARYYLEYWGWYPCTGQPPSTNTEADVGLDWLEVSAQGAIDDARVMAYRYKLLALLLRENGRQHDGHQAIKNGMEAIDKYSTDKVSKMSCYRDLESFDQAWDFPFTHRVSELLRTDAEPKLGPDSRRKNGLSGLLGYFGLSQFKLPASTKAKDRNPS